MDNNNPNTNYNNGNNNTNAVENDNINNSNLSTNLVTNSSNDYNSTNVSQNMTANFNTINSNENLISPTDATEKRPSNKKWLIIIITMTLLIILGVVLFIISSKKGNRNADTNNENQIHNTNIIQATIDSQEIVMLDKNGDLYQYGENNEKITKVASDIKYYVNGGRFIIVDNKDTAYYTGLDIDGLGTSDGFEIVTENIKKIDSNNFCFFIIDKDNNYIVRAPLENTRLKGWCALPNEYDGNFSNIASNVKDIYDDVRMNGYLTNDGDLYVSDRFNVGYQKVLSNVNRLIDNMIIITNDKTAYSLDPYNDEKVIKAVKIADNVTDAYPIGNLLYKTTSNEFYINDDINVKLDFNDIKVPYYLDRSNNIFIYLNNNNKIVLIEKTNKINQTMTGTKREELNLSVDSMKKIYDFINEDHSN